ncbi:MAG: hypothetical protein JWL81_1318 [Verrucomicrobiales bacterium]|nr:hypothetical protein [Verrucomicrobiales bacterium]
MISAFYIGDPPELLQGKSMPPLRHFLLALLCLRLVGGDTALLQMVAWTGMVLSRSSQQGVEQVVQNILEGKDPCELCKVLKKSDLHENGEVPLPGGLVVKVKSNELVPSENVEFPPIQWRDHAAMSRPEPPGGLLICLRTAPAVPPPERA